MYLNNFLTVYIIIVIIITFSLLFSLLFEHNFWCCLFSFFVYLFPPTSTIFGCFPREKKTPNQNPPVFFNQNLQLLHPNASSFFPIFPFPGTCCFFPPHLLSQIPFLAPFFPFLPIQLQIPPIPASSHLFFHRLGIIFTFFFLFFSPRWGNGFGAAPKEAFWFLNFFFFW